MHAYSRPDDRSLLLIALAVTLTHVALLLWVSFYADLSPPPKSVERLVVKTIQLDEYKHPIAASPKPLPVLPTPPPPPPPVIPEPAAATPIPEPTAAAPEPVKIEETAVESPKIEPKELPAEPEPQPKPQKKQAPKTAKPAVQKAKEVPKTKQVPKSQPQQKTSQPQPKKPSAVKETKKENISAVNSKAEAAKNEAAKAKRRALLANAQKNIAQIEKNHDKLSENQSAAMPAQIDSLQVETFFAETGAQLNSQEIGYYDELASYLKLKLRLPEYGEVKLKLTLDRSGRFVKVTIVNSKSERNRKHVEKTLATLKYPSFSGNFGNLAQYTFVIALSNDL